MNKPLKTVLIGAGGYGALYVDWLLDAKDYFNLVGVVDPYAKNSTRYKRLNKIKIYKQLEDFFAENTADLTVISTPVHLHYSQCYMALQKNTHVLCEKPLVPTIKQLDNLDEQVKKTGKTLTVGFQWCFSQIILGIKRRILDGDFGRPVTLKSFVSWPRDWVYYARSWAGKVKTEEGHIVYDSVASNATAHYIHNMLFLAGLTMESAADLHNAKVECYRANNIESFDTIALEGEAAGSKIFFAASHATNYLIEPVMHYTFEKATILANVINQDFVFTIHHKDGRVESLGKTLDNEDNNKVIFTAQSIWGQRPHICTLRTVRPITSFIDKLFEQVPFYDFPNVIKDSQTKATYVGHLHLDLLDSFNREKLPSELGLFWARKATQI